MITVDRDALKQRVDKLREEIIGTLPERLATIATEVSTLQRLADGDDRGGTRQAATAIAYLCHKLNGSLGILELRAAVAISADIEHRCRQLAQQSDHRRDPEAVAGIVECFTALQDSLQK